jgi:hypothetical protein
MSGNLVEDYYEQLLFLFLEETNIRQVVFVGNLSGDVLEDMALIRQRCASVHRIRQEMGIPVRQPLGGCVLWGDSDISDREFGITKAKKKL